MRASKAAARSAESVDQGLPADVPKHYSAWGSPGAEKKPAEATLAGVELRETGREKGEQLQTEQARGDVCTDKADQSS